MNEANYTKVKAELEKVFKAVGKLENERARIVERIEQERQKAGEAVADALMAGDGAEPVKAKTKASNNLDRLESELSETDNTLAALSQKWAKALRIEREAAKAIHEQKAQAASDETERLQEETDALTQRILDLQGEIHTVAVQADEAFTLADEAGEYLKNRVGCFKGSPSELQDRLASDPMFTLNRQQARGLLETWEQGKVVTLRSRIKDKCFPTSIAVFYDKLTGEVLDTRVMSGIGSGNKPLIGVREAKPEELDRIKERLEKSLA